MIFLNRNGKLEFYMIEEYINSVVMSLVSIFFLLDLKFHFDRQFTIVSHTSK